MSKFEKGKRGEINHESGLMTETQYHHHCFSSNKILPQIYYSTSLLFNNRHIYHLIGERGQGYRGIQITTRFFFVVGKKGEG